MTNTINFKCKPLIKKKNVKVYLILVVLTAVIETLVVFAEEKRTFDPIHAEIQAVRCNWMYNRSVGYLDEVHMENPVIAEVLVGGTITSAKHLPEGRINDSMTHSLSVLVLLYPAIRSLVGG